MTHKLDDIHRTTESAHIPDCPKCATLFKLVHSKRVHTEGFVTAFNESICEDAVPSSRFSASKSLDFCVPSPKSRTPEYSFEYDILQVSPIRLCIVLEYLA